MAYKITGRIQATSDGVRLVFSMDIARLLNWFFIKETGLVLRLPKRPAKLSFWNPKFKYQKKPTNLKKFVGRKVTITIDPSKAKHLVSRKGYWVHWLNIEDPTLWELIKEMGVECNFDKRNRPHMSISNGKYGRYQSPHKGSSFFYD